MLPAPGDGLELIEDAAAALRKGQIRVSDIGLRRPTLDDVFLQLTGAPASENGGPPPRATPQPTVKPRKARIRMEAPPPRATPQRTVKPRKARIRMELPPPSAWRGDITDAAVVTGRNLRHLFAN